jgi:hypothetical protein
METCIFWLGVLEDWADGADTVEQRVVWMIGPCVLVGVANWEAVLGHL